MAGTLALLTACGGLGRSSGPREASPETPSIDPATVPDVAEVRCLGSGTRLLTPVIRPQLDGVHIRVENGTDLDLTLQVRYASGGGAGDSGVTEGVWLMPVGRSELRCLDPFQDAGGDEGYVPIEVVDPEGIWVSPELHCRGGAGVTGHSDYAEDARGPQGDPVTIARDELPGLLATDDVERAGYPNETEPERVRVVRDGRVIAVTEYFPDGHGGWLQSSLSACGEDGVVGEP